MSVKWIVVDVESDGQCPGIYSMVSFGAVAVEDPIVNTFKGLTAPMTDDNDGPLPWDPDALAVSGVTHEQHLTYPSAAKTMEEFEKWLRFVCGSSQPVFVSDNPAFDWQWINYYFHFFRGKNPFGFSARRIGDLYAGLVKDVKSASKWKSLRVTKHTHDPVDDAKGNVEALLAMRKMGLNVPV